MVAGNGMHGGAPGDDRSSPLPVLLIEDDDGDALIVEDLLLGTTATIHVHRVRTLAAARPLLSDVSCVLLDLGLPDTFGLEGVHWLHANVPHVAVVVLTGMSDEHLGQEAVRSGAQDYLVKGQVDGHLLHRVIRYSVARQLSDDMQRQLSEARIYAEENARLERGLLPSPLVSTSDLTVAARYQPGGQRMLLGGDFYDVVQSADGWVHALVGDVCGHGPDEAALGVCLRVAWRTMMLAGRPVPETLTILGQVFEHERHQAGLFATLCTVSVAPDRTTGRLFLAGHPPPLLITPAGITELPAPVHTPVGIGDMRHWPCGDVTLGAAWTILMYTDGLVEGRIGKGNERLETEGLIGLVESFRAGRSADTASAADSRDERMLDTLVDQVRVLNGGDLTDDLAVLALSHHIDDNGGRT
jgi:serine phosphatase RsbU (regulator of sigma subunit)